MSHSFLRRVFIFLVFSFSHPSVIACAVCGFADETTWAFVLTTVILTFVPLILFGLICRFIWKRSEDLKRGNP